LRIDELARAVDPSNTVLLLGAGASIPSGAPTGAALANHLAHKVSPHVEGDDLQEISGIIEDRLGRRQLAAAVRDVFAPLEPARGILALPLYPWKAIYTTNFDRLVEKSYAIARKELNVVRSNFEWSNAANNDSAAALYKIHGCISQDLGFGDRSRMVLTEIDYDEVEQYRQVLFKSLSLDMMGATTLVVGQSLRDAHLRDLAKEVGDLRNEGIPGRIFLLVYDYDEDRARLLQRRNIDVVAGSLESLMFELEKATPAPPVTNSVVHVAFAPEQLPAKLGTTTDVVAHAINLAPSAVRLYNGGQQRMPTFTMA
jgi:hypothetical protein